MVEPTPRSLADPFLKGSLREVIRSVYLQENSGILEIQLASEARRFYFQNGELHLLDGHPLARRIAELLGDKAEEAVENGSAGNAPRVSPEAQSELESVVSRIARFLAQLEEGEFAFLAGQDEIPGDLVGPLPTGFLVMELATLDQDEGTILETLGGLEAQFATRRRPGDLERYHWLGTEEVFLLSRLETPLPLGVFLKQVAMDRSVALDTLKRLWAIGLIERVGAKVAEVRGPDDGVTAAVAQKFRERVSGSLEVKPLNLTVEEHRQQLGDLLATLGEQDHYQLLKLRRDATLEQVHSNYEVLARLVHPDHAEKLQLRGKEQALDFLFERATEAYLTLSDPRRRGLYDQRMDYNILDEDPEDEEERNRDLGREYYRLARKLVETQQFHAAHELLRDAARRDPRPEYFALLGQVQAKNPNWTRRAVESYRKAVELAPNSVDLRLGLAMTCEKGGYGTEAKLHYENVLARMPGHPAAIEALRRLGSKKKAEKKKKSGGLLSWLFARGS